MKNLAGKSILFFCPDFFGYQHRIKEKLEELGANVIWFDERPSNSFFSKGLIRINKNILTRKIESYYDSILNKVKSQEFDYLFFVNPEAVSKKILDSFQNAFPNAQSVLYMWDSFRNKKQNLELLPLFDEKFTFDPQDAQEYDLKFRPLFYIEPYRQKRKKKVDYDLLFIGTAHSERYTLVKKLEDLIGEREAKLYFYLSNRRLFVIKKIFEKEFRKAKYKDISFESLSHDCIADLMMNSDTVLDINHPDQIGLTMRTFETLASQRKLITTNSNILEYDFYNSNNILLIDRDNPVITEDFFDKPFIPYNDTVLDKYSIEGWIKDIFNIC